MTELDLSLLTDERLAAWLRQAEYQLEAGGECSGFYFGDLQEASTTADLLRALIAARAENRRLLDERSGEEQYAKKDRVVVEAVGLLQHWHSGNSYLSGHATRLAIAMLALHPDYEDWDYEELSAALQPKKEMSRDGN